MPEQPYEPERAIAGTGMGGAMDLGASEAVTLEPAPGGAGAPGPVGRPRSLWSDAWHDLRRNPVFLVSALVILFLVVISLWPSAIASGDPLTCDLAKAREGGAAGASLRLRRAGLRRLHPDRLRRPGVRHGRPVRHARGGPAGVGARRPGRLLRRAVGRGPVPDHGHLLRHPGRPRRPRPPLRGDLHHGLAGHRVHGAARLAADLPHRARLGHHRQAARLRPGRPRPRRLRHPHPAPAHRPERRGPRDRRRDHRARHLHRPGGDPVPTSASASNRPASPGASTSRPPPRTSATPPTPCCGPRAPSRSRSWPSSCSATRSATPSTRS